MSEEMARTDFEEMLRDSFERERESLRLPTELRSKVTSAIASEEPGSRRRRGTVLVLAVAAALLAIGIVGASSAVFRGGTDERGAHVGAHSYDTAPEALNRAIASLPYRVDLPTHIPQDMRVRLVGAHIPNMSIAYVAAADGTTWRPELSISWIYHRPDATPLPPYPSDLPGNFEDLLPTPGPGDAFQSGGYVWSTNYHEWRDGDSWEAVTLREDGVQVFVSLRVAGGLDKDETLAELRNVIDSMRPVTPE